MHHIYVQRGSSVLPVPLAHVKVTS